MAYDKTNWENFPSQNTPLNSNNLNKIENELDVLDKAITKQTKKRIWYGNEYQLNTQITLDEPLEEGGIYLIEFKGLSGAYKSTEIFMCHATTYASLCQINYYSVPDSKGFRYRIEGTNNSKIIKISDASNTTTNTAITDIYKIGNFL